MSLEQKIKDFVERQRAILLQRLQAEADNDTEVVKWDGFDADGNPQVKTDDQTKSADGLGLVTNTPGSELIYDKAGSVDYRKSGDIVNPSLRTPRYNVTPVDKKPVVPQNKPRPLQVDQNFADSSNFYTALGVDDGDNGTPFPPADDENSRLTTVVIMDENDGNDTTSAWASYRTRYPNRRFYLLQPADAGFGDLFVPSAFNSDPNAYHKDVPRNPTLDWSIYRYIDLQGSLSGNKIIIAIDNSGSMTTQDVRAAYLGFKAQAIDRSDFVYAINVTNEDYIGVVNFSESGLFPQGFTGDFSALDATLS